MNKRIKKLWVKALRSGEYKQTTGRLRRNRGKNQASFCCLGVLCNLHAQAHPEIAAAQTDKRLYMGKSELPPEEVMLWAGIEGTDPVVVIGRGLYEHPVRLSTLNDSGHSFEEIAELIERQL